MTEASELGKAVDVIKKEQRSAALKLLSGLSDLQDTLSLTYEEKFKSTPECAPLIYANESLMSFLDAGPSFTDARPRSIRDEDRKKILPGQHAGVFLLLDLNDGTRCKINFYGGLRTIAGQDMKDSDKSLKSSHATRTDNIVTQTTHINWQITYLSGPTIDSWITYRPDNGGFFQQSSLVIDGQYIDCQPRVSSEDSAFGKISNEIFAPITELTRIVPSSV